MEQICEEDCLCGGVLLTHAFFKHCTDNGLCTGRREGLYSILFLSSGMYWWEIYQNNQEGRMSIWVLVLMLHSGPIPGPQPGVLSASIALVHFCQALRLSFNSVHNFIYEPSFKDFSKLSVLLARKSS